MLFPTINLIILIKSMSTTQILKNTLHKPSTRVTTSCLKVVRLGARLILAGISVEKCGCLHECTKSKAKLGSFKQFVLLMLRQSLSNLFMWVL